MCTKSNLVETQVMFKEGTQNDFKIIFDENFTERLIISDMVTQVDIGSSQNVNGPKFLIGAHQTRARADTANKNSNIVIFDHLNLPKYYIENDGIRYPRDDVLVNFGQNDYIEQNKDLKLFFKDYVGEELLTPFIFYPDMKTKFPLEVKDLRHQHGHITLENIQLFNENGDDTENARFFLILIRRREKELILDGDKLIEVKVI